MTIIAGTIGASGTGDDAVSVYSISTEPGVNIKPRPNVIVPLQVLT